ncbi:MAG TPA: TonB-dependent receptor [Terriglobales bacterium]|nr:TonB-dependent receptor [Terriglobales bacterium]
MRTFAARFMVLLPTLCGFTLVSFAQFSQRGSIDGVVTEASGAVLAKASVTLLDIERNQTSSSVTDANGHYEFSQLLPGTYQVSVQSPGFKKAVSEPLQVSPQSAVRYDFQLQVGAVSEQVVVTTATPLLETESAELNQTISQEQIESVPMNGRNWTSLTELTPGVSTSPRVNINLGGTYEVGASYTSGGADYTAGGNAEGSRDNGYYVNGVNANENYESGSSFQPSAESIGEVKIGVADFSAQYGRDFTNVNVTTKAGTNIFHGEIYDYFENDALNALVPINKAQGLLTKSAYRFNQYGGGLGGPIYIPKILNLKDRAFFFVNYERNPHSLTGPNNLAIVPSAAQRAGDFAGDCTGPINAGTFNPANGLCSNPAGQIYNPYTGSPIPFNNLVTAGLFNPATASSQITGIINLFPQANLAPTAANDGANYQYSSRMAVTPYHWDSRYDYRISSKDSVFVAWSQYKAIPNNAGGLVPNLMQANANVSDKSHVVTIDEAHVFSSHLTNEFIFAIGSGALQTLSPEEISYANSSSNPFNSIFEHTGTASAGNTGILGLNIFNYGVLFTQPSVGYEEYFLASNNSRQFSDNLNWIRGRHTMTFGFNYLRKAEEDFDNVRYVAYGCAPAPGAYCGNGPQIFTASQGVGGDAFADVLLGLPSVVHQRFSYTVGAFAPEPNAVIPYYGAYFNDNLKVTQRLTVSYGLRYELPIPIFATNSLCCAIYEAATDTLSTPGIAPSVPQHYAPAPKHDFAPRLSLAMQLNPKTVVRAGYGLYYNSGASQISNLLSGALYGGVPGGFVGYEIDNSTPQEASRSQVFPASPQVALGTYPAATGAGQGYYGAGAYQTVFYANQQSFPTPYIHRYMLDIQREVARNSVITVSYLGAEGRNGWYFYDLNVPPYRTGWPSITAYDNARPYNSGRFGDIYLQKPGLNSNYSAGIVKFQRQLTNGLQILTHYTYSKTLGDRGINGQGTQDTGYNYPQSIIRSYGEETYSHRHRFLFETIYGPKYAEHLPRYVRPALGDWHISAITTLESGDALTVYNGAGNQANDYAPYNGLGNLDMLRNPNFPHSQRTFAEYFNTSAFEVPPTNVQGTASPGVVRGPGQNNWDIAFGKNINFTERLHAELRADMYNAFNHTQWNAVSTQLNGSTGPFGQVTGSREGRIIQLAAKVVF